MAMPVTRLERRQVPRMTVDRFAYINIEPNNGGSLLNVSENGLCFHCIAPIARDRAIHFWFSEQDRRIEGVGEVAWMDEAQKTVGIKFASLSPEARESLLRWISMSVVPDVRDKQAHKLPAFDISRLEKPAVPGVTNSVMGAPSNSVKLPLLTGFVRGLMTGLAVAIFVAGGFIASSYRQEFGEWLIHTGERFASKPQTQTAALQPAATPAPQIAPIPAMTVSAVQAGQTSTQHPETTPSATPVPQPSKFSLPASPDKPQPAPETSTNQPSAVIVPANNPKARSAEAPLSVPAPPALPSGSSQLSADMIRSNPALPQRTATNQPPTASSTEAHVEVETSGKTSSGPPPEMYFEVGRSKSPTGAHELSDKLEQIGFHSSVTQRGHLWSNAYAVLVGPYSDEDAAAAAGKTLVSHDFTPRAFERGTRDIELRSGLTLNGERIPGGDCTITWESYITGTVVKVWQGQSVIVKSDGRWRKSDTKFKHDAFVYRKNLDGSKTLLEIQFIGLKRALVFNKPS